MAHKLTLKQDLFVLAYIETGNATEAYRRAYNTATMLPATICRRAVFELDKSKIRASVAERRAAHAHRHNCTVDSLTGELEDARELAMTAREGAGAAVSATMGKAKLHGHIVDTKVTADVSGLFLDILRGMGAASKAEPGDDAKVIEPETQPDGERQANSDDGDDTDPVSG